MYILGDIGNSDTKLCLVSTRNKIIKKINFPSKNLNDQKLTGYFNSLKPDYKKINKILFCSVVPKSRIIKLFFLLIKDTYYGGIIAPGIRLSLDTLSDKATLIPRINLKMIKNVIGKDTVSAVRSGFFLGLRRFN